MQKLRLIHSKRKNDYLIFDDFMFENGKRRIKINYDNKKDSA